MHESGGRWVGSNAVVEQKKKEKHEHPETFKRGKGMSEKAILFHKCPQERTGQFSTLSQK